ncbi:HSP20-like chaperone [Mycena vitilis]|nr:HSP20-like chaperone [Mycena vitilis]
MSPRQRRLPYGCQQQRQCQPTPGSGRVEPVVLNTVTATFELPRVKKEDVQIETLPGHLRVSAECKLSDDHDKDGYVVRERRFGKYARTLQLPQGVKEEEIKASMEHGVLTVIFPMATPELGPKKIQIA